MPLQLAAPDITRAAADDDYFAEELARLGGRNSDAGARFEAAVEAAYNAAKARPLLYAEKKILGFEKRRFRDAGTKEQKIRDEFGCSATAYYQRLNALLDRPEALAHDPMLVGRLRRLRGTRGDARTRTGRAA